MKRLHNPDVTVNALSIIDKKCFLPHLSALALTMGSLNSAWVNEIIPGKARLGYRPLKKSIRRMVENVHGLTTYSMSWQDTTVVVGKLNRMLRGWAKYPQVGTVIDAYRALEALQAR